MKEVLRASWSVLVRDIRHIRQDRSDFPHEMGFFLGYPKEDVEGFIVNGGRNFLYAGYWKVYANRKAKISLFEKFENARETMITFVSNGGRIEEFCN